MGVNGWLSVTQPNYASNSAYYYRAGSCSLTLPGSDNNGCYLPDTLWAPLWQDLYIYKGTPQGLYYQITGSTVGSRNVSFEWYTSQFSAPTQYYHFIATFQEAVPGQAVFDYYQVSNNGAAYQVQTSNGQTFGSQVGVQKYSTGQSAVYSNNQPNVLPGLELVFTPPSTFTVGAANCVKLS
ncbi:hypothetical protein BAUCODRAFT_542010 [Baudoinia panamericana UAMH 10762]|uniref:Uncharacterized protein n=1 Tax=Baudoinia panamericana (strain UAMH 10762) TaxID=717646 RepID=M2N8M1_BAUPA|nr:uncharacterized protein BAUCODRAFT_542010 [Baudoinia panamericana UAMH 10762]EMC95444.1 hypothetical protein BAUCODRAFT_542010 [Baudoinia panamericana UAMH 10762]